MLMMIMVKTHSKRKKNRHNDDVDERRRRVIFPAPGNFVKSLFEIKCCTQRRDFISCTRGNARVQMLKARKRSKIERNEGNVEI